LLNQLAPTRCVGKEAPLGEGLPEL
jgi:hypothetical protein